MNAQVKEKVGEGSLDLGPGSSKLKVQCMQRRVRLNHAPNNLGQEETKAPAICDQEDYGHLENRMCLEWLHKSEQQCAKAKGYKHQTHTGHGCRRKGASQQPKPAAALKS